MKIPETTPQDIGEKIATLRKQNNYTQKKLAEILEISPQTLIRYEKGKAIPSASMLVKMSQALNVCTEAILKPLEKLQPEPVLKNGRCALFPTPKKPADIPEILKEEPKF